MDKRSDGLRDADAMTLRGLLLVGAVVYDARRRAGVTQRHLGRVAGVHQSTISRLERGHLNGLRLKRLARILAYLEQLSRPR